jgi:GATA-binding protein, other eukaryote
MKSDVIRKRSRHDARRTSITGPEDTPSESTGLTSTRTSPVPEASPTLAPDSTTQLSYDFEDSDSFRPISAPSASELMGALGTLTSASVVSHVGDTTHGGLYQTPSSPYTHSHTLSSALTSSSGMSLYPGPYHPDYLLQFSNVPGDALPFSSVDSVEVDAGVSPRSNKRRRMSTDSAEDPPPSAVSFASYSTTGDGGYNSTASSTSHGHSHSLSHTMSRGHSHSFSLSHNHSHSLSSHVHSHSLSHGHGHAKRSSMDFPFSTYNANGTINSGPVLRGSGNTFWHPPMLPQTGSDNESHLFHPHGNNSNNSNSNSNSNSSNGGNENGASEGGRSTGGGNNNNEDSAMDYLHPPQMLQDEDNLFSAYVHPPMALPEDAGQSAGDANDGNMHTSMYVDSSYYH